MRKEITYWSEASTFIKILLNNKVTKVEVTLKDNYPHATSYIIEWSDEENERLG